MHHFLFYRMFVADYVFFHFLEQVGCKHEVTQRLVCSLINQIPVAYPLAMTLINKYDIQKKLLPQMISRDKENERIWGLVWRTFVRRSFYEK